MGFKSFLRFCRGERQYPRGPSNAVQPLEGGRSLELMRLPSCGIFRTSVLVAVGGLALTPHAMLTPLSSSRLRRPSLQSASSCSARMIWFVGGVREAVQY